MLSAMSKLLYAWERSRSNQNVAGTFGQYNSEALFQNLQRWLFCDLNILAYHVFMHVLHYKIPVSKQHTLLFAKACVVC